MDAALQDLKERLDTLDRGSPAWVNIADAFVARAANTGDAAQHGDADVGDGDGEIMLRNLSQTAFDAITYGLAECEAMGMEVVGLVVGYPDEATEIAQVVRETLRKWREAKDGEPLPDPIEPDAEGGDGEGTVEAT